MAHLMKYLLSVIIFFLFINNIAVYAKPVENAAIAGTANTVCIYRDTPVILIPFDYKQSALYHGFTYEVIDSVVNMLLLDKDITLSIDGFVHPDEGNDTICKYLSLNRALFVRDYILGRGVDSNRILYVRGSGRIKPKYSNKQGRVLNCRAELKINYPLSEEEIRMADIDQDGIPDVEDGCVNEFGYKENNGCPDKDAIIIPFENQQSSLSPFTYKALDSVVLVLRENPTFTVTIQGHAYRLEGVNSRCDRLAKERAEVVRKYLLSRNISAKRILAVAGFSNRRPVNAGKNPLEQFANSRAQILLKK
jgi:outer membrane protein OmpA-like peptidoglycan-associated protein